MKLPPIPTTDNPQLNNYLRSLSLAIDMELRVRVPNGTAVAALLLVSPAGKVYSVGVDDAGVLATTLVSDV